MNELTSHTVEELMVPINDFPTLSAEATLLDAFRMLCRPHHEGGPFGFRRILVLKNDGRIKGLLTISLLLKAMEPALLNASPGERAEGYWSHDDGRDNLALELFWDEVMRSPQREVVKAHIGTLVAPPERIVTPETSLSRALSYLLTFNQPLLPVEESGTVVAVIRLVDIFNLVCAKVLDGAEDG